MSYTELPLIAEVLLREYELCKNEQTQRISTRDNLVYATLLSMAAVIAATLQAVTMELLLLLPPACLVLGWTYLVNDQKVSALGSYLRTDLGPRLETLVGQRVLGWEMAHRSDRRRVSRKVGQLVVDLLTFIVPAVSALVTYWARVPPTPILFVALVEFAGTMALAYQIIVYADLHRGHGSAPEGPPSWRS